MRMFARLAVCVFACNAAHADEATQCRANDGTYLSGHVTAAPIFARGHFRDGVELSHTHLRLLSDRDGQSYDVAVDNVFAAGYDAAGESVPAPLSRIRVGDHLGLCGKPYANATRGIDWVHTDCGAMPSPREPNGWLKILDANGAPGRNLESSREYCRLWQ